MAILDTNADLLPQLCKIEKDPKTQIIRTEQHPETGNYRTYYIAKGQIKSIIYGLKNYFLFNFWTFSLNLEATPENIKKFQTN